MNVFHQVAKNVEVTRGKICALLEDVEVFPSQIFEAYPSPDWQYWYGYYNAKGWFRPTTFQCVLGLWHVAESLASKKQTTPHCSSLLVPISNAGQTHFTLCSSLEQ